MMISPTLQKILIVSLVLIVVAFFGYRIFIQTAELPVGEADLSGIAVGQDILDLAQETEKIVIDKSLFSSVIFTSLIDFQIVPTPEAQGRVDPFANVGNEAATPAL